MSERSFVGIDVIGDNELIVALCRHKKIILSRPFKNTGTDLGALVKFITDYCATPKICVKSTNPSAMPLIALISSIPDVEVVLMSNAGLQMYRSWLPENRVSDSLLKDSSRGQACFLAYCAERVA